MIILALMIVLGALTVIVTIAQVSTGSIRGSVTDSSGGAIAGTDVSVKNVATGVTQTVTTDSQGRYEVPNILVGQYDVQAQKEGFRTTVHTGLTVIIGTTSVADIVLTVGQLTQTVNVDASAAQVNTTTEDVASLVNQEQLQNLPLNGRNFEQLIFLAPGTILNTSDALGSLMGRFPDFSVNGARTMGQYFVMDGTPIQTFWNSGAGNILVGTSLGLDSIGEFTVITSTYGAEYGGSGSAINQVTKSGTNHFHGTAYDYLRNSTFDARNYFDPLEGSGVPPPFVPPFRRNQYGGSVGGPIKQSKAFFFVNYEGLSQLLETTQDFFVPSNLVRGTDPADPPGEGCIAPPSLGGPCYPLSPIQQQTLALYVVPNPTLAPIADGIGEGSAASNSTVHENYVNTRVDYNLSDRDSFFGRFLYDTALENDSFASGASPGFPESGHGLNTYATLEWKRVLSPNLINLVRFGFTRTKMDTLSAVIPGSPLNFFPGRDISPGILTIGGLSILGTDGNTPIQQRQNKFYESDDIIWLHGGHSVRAGVTIARQQSNSWTALADAGSYSFQNIAAFLQNEQCPTSSGLACATGAYDFNGGYPGEDNGHRDIREIDFSPYYQDDWKVRRNLTLNLGLRWDFATNPIEEHGLLNEIIDPLTSTGYSHVPNAYASNPSWTNWQPRIGFAYSPFSDNKTSIRGAYGIYDDVVTERQIVLGYDSNPPYFWADQNDPAPFPGGFTSSIAPPVPSQPQALAYKGVATPYLQEYNLNVQRQLTRNSVLTVGYVGSKGTHFYQVVDVNPPKTTTAPDGQLLFLGPDDRINPNLSEVYFMEPTDNTNYNSLQVTYTDTFRRSIQTQVSYTYSHCLDYASQEQEYSLAASIAQLNPYPSGRHAEYGRCNFDIRHNLTANSVANLPFHGNRFVTGWTINGILTAHTGGAFTVADGIPQSNTDFFDNTDRPNLAPGGSLNPIVGRVTEWFNPADFVLEPANEVGNVPRNTLTGPGLFDLDMSIIKTTVITESLRLEFRAEFFNILNHSSFQLPNTNLFVGVNPDGTGTPNPEAGVITATTTTSREIQFGLKFIF
jgi:hypothetical protein